MRRSRSLYARLHRSFLFSAVLASAILGLFLYIDFEFYHPAVWHSFGLIGVLRELAVHVFFPIIVMLIPLSITTKILLANAIRPLEETAESIRSATSEDRGFRVDGSEIPEEVDPFIDAINMLLVRLDDAARSQEGFAADVAHELRSGLSAVMLELEAMNTARARRAMQDIEGMNRLIEQILMLAKLDAHVASPQPAQPIDLHSAALDALKLVTPYSSTMGVSVKVIDDDPPPISGHYEAIVAALRNLAENSVRVTPRGGEVVVTCGSGARVSVSDGGPGIPVDELAHCCDRFQRAENASEKGAGLGLSIVSRVMRLHGGHIETDPQKSTLTVHFHENRR